MCALLRDIRVEAGLTQVEFAKALRRNQAYVSAVERGITRTDPLQLRAWCITAGTTLERFARRMEKALTATG